MGSGAHRTPALQDTAIPNVISSRFLWPGGLPPASHPHLSLVGKSVCINEQALKPPTQSPEPFPPAPQGAPCPQILSCRQQTLHLHCCHTPAFHSPSLPVSPRPAAPSGRQQTEPGHCCPLLTGMTQLGPNGGDTLSQPSKHSSKPRVVLRQPARPRCSQPGQPCLRRQRPGLRRLLWCKSHPCVPMGPLSSRTGAKCHGRRERAELSQLSHLQPEMQGTCIPKCPCPHRRGRSPVLSPAGVPW